MAPRVDVKKKCVTAERMDPFKFFVREHCSWPGRENDDMQTVTIKWLQLSETDKNKYYQMYEDDLAIKFGAKPVDIDR